MLCPARNKTNVLKRSVLLIACQPLKTCVRVSFGFSIPVFKNKHKRIGISIYVPMKKKHTETVFKVCEKQSGFAFSCLTF